MLTPTAAKRKIQNEIKRLLHTSTGKQQLLLFRSEGDDRFSFENRGVILDITCQIKMTAVFLDTAFNVADTESVVVSVSFGRKRSAV